MNSTARTRHALVMTSLALASTATLAQTSGNYTLISPAMPAQAQTWICTLTNVTNQTGVYITKLEIVDRGTALGANTCAGSNLAPGMNCSRSTNIVDPHAPQPYCRAQYYGPEGAVVGSFYATYTDANFGPVNSGPVLPLRQVKGVTLPAAN